MFNFQNIINIITNFATKHISTARKYFTFRRVALFLLGLVCATCTAYTVLSLNYSLILLDCQNVIRLVYESTVIQISLATMGVTLSLSIYFRRYLAQYVIAMRVSIERFCSFVGKFCYSNRWVLGSLLFSMLMYFIQPVLGPLFSAVLVAPVLSLACHLHFKNSVLAKRESRNTAAYHSWSSITSKFELVDQLARRLYSLSMFDTGADVDSDAILFISEYFNQEKVLKKDNIGMFFPKRTALKKHDVHAFFGTTTDSELHVCFRGTPPSTFAKAVQHNLEANGPGSKTYDDVKSSIMDEVSSRVKARMNEHMVVNISGHSLGGAYAQRLALECVEAFKDHNVTVRLWLLQAAPMHWESTAVNDERLLKALDNSQAKFDIILGARDGDPVGVAGSMLGSTLLDNLEAFPKNLTIYMKRFPLSGMSFICGILGLFSDSKLSFHSWPLSDAKSSVRKSYFQNASDRCSPAQYYVVNHEQTIDAKDITYVFKESWVSSQWIMLLSKPLIAALAYINDFCIGSIIGFVYSLIMVATANDFYQDGERPVADAFLFIGSLIGVVQLLDRGYHSEGASRLKEGLATVLNSESAIVLKKHCINGYNLISTAFRESTNLSGDQSSQQSQDQGSALYGQ